MFGPIFSRLSLVFLILGAAMLLTFGFNWFSVGFVALAVFTHPAL